MYVYLKNRSASFLILKVAKNVQFSLFSLFTQCRFQNMPVTVPFSKSTAFKNLLAKVCCFLVSGRPIDYIFHHFKNVPASQFDAGTNCERSLRGYFLLFSRIQETFWKYLKTIVTSKLFEKHGFIPRKTTVYGCPL